MPIMLTSGRPGSIHAGGILSRVGAPSSNRIVLLPIPVGSSPKNLIGSADPPEEPANQLTFFVNGAGNGDLISFCRAAYALAPLRLIWQKRGESVAVRAVLRELGEGSRVAGTQCPRGESYTGKWQVIPGVAATPLSDCHGTAGVGRRAEREVERQEAIRRHLVRDHTDDIEPATDGLRVVRRLDRKELMFRGDRLEETRQDRREVPPVAVVVGGGHAGYCEADHRNSAVEVRGHGPVLRLLRLLQTLTFSPVRDRRSENRIGWKCSGVQTSGGHRWS